MNTLTKLPKIWHVIVTEENKAVLSEWREFIDNHILKVGEIVGMVFDGTYEKGHNPGDTIKTNTYDFGEEISFADFKRLVLKEVFPDNWAIKRTLETDQAITEYMNERHGVNHSLFKYNSSSPWMHNCVGLPSHPIIKSGYIEISYDEFVNNVLNPSVDIDIIAYKLIKEYPLCKIKLGEILDDDNEFCSKYPEYWEPLFRNKYKVGDWITVTGNAIGWLTSEVGETFEIIGPKSNYNGGTWWEISSAVRRKSGGLCADFRRATPKEIENAKIPHMAINGYKAEYFNTYVKFGCASIETSTFIELHKICMETDKTGNRSILSVTIGKGTFYAADIKRIAEYYMKK